jgi:glycerol-3-phosphate dehydrogenase
MSNSTLLKNFLQLPALLVSGQVTKVTERAFDVYRMGFAAALKPLITWQFLSCSLLYLTIVTDDANLLVSVLSAAHEQAKLAYN